MHHGSRPAQNQPNRIGVGGVTEIEADCSSCTPLWSTTPAQIADTDTQDAEGDGGGGAYLWLLGPPLIITPSGASPIEVRSAAYELPPPSSVSRTRNKSKRNKKVPPRGLGGGELSRLFQKQKSALWPKSPRNPSFLFRFDFLRVRDTEEGGLWLCMCVCVCVWWWWWGVL
jgi:hypothetical protein